MRKLKSGFTLAEVLITIAVIGIVAAMTLPNMITGYQYKTIGVKLSKFAASTEASARAFVAANGVLSADNLRTFGQESFLRVGTADEFALAASAPADLYTALTAVPANGTYSLKDGTIVTVIAGGGAALEATVDQAMYGAAVANVYFDPHINGLPAPAQKVYRFALTELGYVFPDSADTCLAHIADPTSDGGSYNTPGALYTGTTGACRKSS